MLRVVLTTGLALFAVGSVGLFVLQAVVAADAPQDDRPRTVIVLGSDVVGDHPGTTLTARLDAALRYLDDDPSSPVIVTGNGRSARTEAEVMRDYLVAHGVAASRIHTEEQAGNTPENFAYAADIIRDQGFPTDVVVITSDFHQLRSSIYAGREGLSASHVSAPTHWSQYIPASVREHAIIVLREWWGLPIGVEPDPARP